MKQKFDLKKGTFEKRGTERNPNQGVNGFGADVEKSKEQKQATEKSFHCTP